MVLPKPNLPLNNMLKNYLRVALRSLSKNKSYIAINTLGLGISLACCITVYLLLAYNIEFDNFHKNEKVSHVYRVHTLSRENDGRNVRDNLVPYVLPPIAAEEIAGLERYTRFTFGSVTLRYEETAFDEFPAFVDSTFFELFDFPLLYGSVDSFKDKRSIFLSEKLAKKYFGNENPVGKLMVLNAVNDTQIELLVGGVVKNYPLNNTFTFDALLRTENFADIHRIAVDNWAYWRNPSVFFEVSNPENIAQINKELDKYKKLRNEVKTDMVVDAYELIPFKSSYDSQDDIRMSATNHRIGITPLVIFISMALLILLIACFNLTNTSIAMTARRLKEVGVRKTVGAARMQIILQFFLETTLIIVISLLVGLMMAQFIVPAFANMWGLEYGLRDLDGVNLFVAMLVMIFLASLLAGIYPALFGSKLRPAQLLKGNVRIKGTNPFTQTLVAFQFALSVIVLIAGVVFIQNTKYQEQIEFGYDKDMIVSVNIRGERDYQLLKNTLSTHPKIQSIAVSDGNIGSSNYTTTIKIDSMPFEVQALAVGENYFETMGLRFAQGRAFNHESESDKGSVIVNQAFLEKTGLQDPIDKMVYLNNLDRPILGVIENHIDNLYRSKDPEPFIFHTAHAHNFFQVLVKANPEDLPEIQQYLEATWKELFPTRPFVARLQDDFLFQGSRRTNANLEKIFFFITILGGLLSACGIFALASLNIEKRTKEVGIRKVLGASILHIVNLLNREFMWTLLAASILGSFGGYYLINALLADMYAYHVPVGIITVILCAFLILIVGLFTTSATIAKAARSNPVDTLRSE